MGNNSLVEIFDTYYNMYFKKYQDIIDVMDAKKDIDSICNITQKEIANKLNMSQTLVSKCLIRLERSDKCIEKIKSGVYKINHTNMRKYGVYPKVIKYIFLNARYEGFSELTLKERAQILKMTKEEVIMVIGYWIEFARELTKK